MALFLVDEMEVQLHSKWQRQLADEFRRQLSIGHIYPNPELTPQAHVIVEQTIERLALDDTPCRNLRAGWFDEYVRNQIDADYLRRESPFVRREAQRQGLL